MTKKLTEDEFLELFGWSFYLAMKDEIFMKMQNTPEFKNDEPYCVQMAVFQLANIGKPMKDWTSIMIAADANKHGALCDFGFRLFIVSTEAMPDEYLDFYNELMGSGMKTIKN